MPVASAGAMPPDTPLTPRTAAVWDPEAGKFPPAWFVDPRIGAR